MKGVYKVTDGLWTNDYDGKMMHPNSIDYCTGNQLKKLI